MKQARTNDDLRVVGQPLPQSQVTDKVTGRAQYTGDISLPGMAAGALVKSPEAKGRIRSIDATEAASLPGVLAVITAADLRAAPIGCRDLRYGVVVRDRPILAEERVCFVGEPVAAVVAEDARTARAAADLVIVDIEPEPAATDLVTAIGDAAPIVHPDAFEVEDGLYNTPLALAYGDTNVCLEFETGEGDVDTAFSSAARVFERSYSFPAVYQYAMEPHTVVADADDERLTVWSSAQHPSQVTKDLARLYDLPLGAVRVIVPYVGGGFGSKSFTHVEPLAVALSRAAARPVKLELDVSEAMTVSRRHAARSRVRVAVDDRGSITAYDAELHYDTGAYTLLGPFVAVAGAYRALGGYAFPAYRVRSNLVHTNLPSAGSFRAVGGPQAAWGLEAELNRVARELGRDPVELRRELVAEHGQQIRADRTPMDADLQAGLDALVDDGAPADPPSEDGVWRVGTGVALGICNPGASPVSSALVRLAADGSVVIMAGSTELGQGSKTVLRQIAAEALGVAYDVTTVLATDTGYGPYDASTGASRSTTMSGLAVQRAASQVRARLQELVASWWGCHADQVEVDDGRVTGPDGPSRDLGWVVREHFGENGGNLYGVGEVTAREFPTKPPFWEVAGAAVTIAVDEQTGRIRVLDYRSMADLGRVINPLLMEGQEEGAIVQGLGHTLFESLAWEDGQPLSNTMVDYRVPRMGDVPSAFHSTFLENGDGPGPYGAKGGGEGGIMPVAGAVAGALSDATGAQVVDLPMTPERVWRAINDARDAAGGTT